MLYDVNHVIPLVLNVVEMTSVEDARFARRDSTGRTIPTMFGYSLLSEGTQAVNHSSATVDWQPIWRNSTIVLGGVCCVCPLDAPRFVICFDSGHGSIESTDNRLVLHSKSVGKEHSMHGKLPLHEIWAILSRDE